MTRLAILFEQGAVNDGEIVLGDGPLEWHARAGQFLGGFAMGFDGLCEPRRAALAVAKRFERGAETYLGRGPIERHAIAGIFLQRVAIGFDSLLEPGRPAPPLAEHSERIAEI